jgi:hypothetical protein
MLPPITTACISTPDQVYLKSSWRRRANPALVESCPHATAYRYSDKRTRIPEQKYAFERDGRKFDPVSGNGVWIPVRS